jgi:hypothetical protein
MNEYIVPWDIAKRFDRLAGMIFRRTPELIHDPLGGSRSIEYLDLLHIEQHVGLSYPEAGQAIADLQGHKLLRGNSDLLLDETGVGEAVVDIVRSKGVRAIGIIFSGGDKPHPIVAPAMTRFSHEPGRLNAVAPPEGWTVPRKDLVAAGQVILQQGRLRTGKGIKNADQFKAQLEGFTKVRTGKYEAATDALHDDLVMDFLLASWWLLQTKTDESKHDAPIALDQQTAPEWDPIAL